MSSIYKEIKQGETLLLSVKPLDENKDVYDLSVGTWLCTVVVYDSNGVELDRTTTTNTNTANDTFLPYFEPTETDTWSEGVVTIAQKVERTDTTPAINIQESLNINIEARVIAQV